MAVNNTTLWSGSPSATPPPDRFPSPSPRIWLWRAVTFFAASFAVCMTYGFRSWCQWSWVVLQFGIISMTEYVLPFLFLTFKCSMFTKLTNDVTQRNSDMPRAKASNSWRRINQAGHNMLLLVPRIFICVKWKQQACWQTRALSSRITTESQQW